MIPILSRLQADRARLRLIYRKATGLLAAACVPGVAVAVATAPEITRLLFGEAWLPVDESFAWLGVAGLVQLICYSTGWLFIAQGRTRAMFRWGLYGSTVTCLGFFLACGWTGCAGWSSATRW
jgi:O-antigen/teichoic acid export membrane protein